MVQTSSESRCKFRNGFYPVCCLQKWELLMVLKTEGIPSSLRQDPAVYVLEVKPTEFNPSDEDKKKAEVMDPSHEPSGIKVVLRENWHKLITFENLLRNIVRLVSILWWTALHTLWTRQMWRPFQMMNLLKFQDGEGVYDLYRNTAGKLIMANGGGLAFLGKAQGLHPAFDEVMVVTYKTRFQFLRLALLTPGYWPLCLLRDEGLKDSMLHAATPIDIAAAKASRPSYWDDGL